jgi:hypothetical protein
LLEATLSLGIFGAALLGGHGRPPGAQAHR